LVLVVVAIIGVAYASMVALDEVEPDQVDFDDDIFKKCSKVSAPQHGRQEGKQRTSVKIVWSWSINGTVKPGCPVQKFVIRCHERRTGALVRRVEVGAATRTIQIHNLKNGTNYQVKMNAFSSNGLGSKEHSISASTTK